MRVEIESCHWDPGISEARHCAYYRHEIETRAYLMRLSGDRRVSKLLAMRPSGRNPSRELEGRCGGHYRSDVPNGNSGLCVLMPNPSLVALKHGAHAVVCDLGAFAQDQHLVVCPNSLKTVGNVDDRTISELGVHKILDAISRGIIDR